MTKHRNDAAINAERAARGYRKRMGRPLVFAFETIVELERLGVDSERLEVEGVIRVVQPVKLAGRE